MRRALVAILAVVALGAFAGDADPYAEALALLRQAQADHSVLVPAVKALAKVAEEMEKANDPRITEVNACLYWSRKRLTLADTQALGGNGTVKRLEVVAKVVPVSEAKTMLDRAEAFAKGHADDPLLVAIQYFEVADRFPETAEGRKAIQQSLASMQKVGEKAKLETYKPAPTDGRAFIKSEPAGAAIVLVNADGKIDTGKVTPSLVQLPVGRQTLELTLRGRKPTTLAVEVDGKAIAKPDIATLNPLTVPIDIVFEDGWFVFVDGKRAKVAGKKEETPCTAELPLGGHELGLAKEGFLDVKCRVTISESGAKQPSGMSNSIEIKDKPSRGVSMLTKTSTEEQVRNEAKEKAEQEKIVGKYRTWGPLWQGIIVVSADGTFRGGADGGKWTFAGGMLTLKWDKFGDTVVKKDEKGQFIGKGSHDNFVGMEKMGTK